MKSLGERTLYCALQVESNNGLCLAICDISSTSRQRLEASSTEDRKKIKSERHTQMVGQ
jgi:hypothetical protein